VHFVYLTRDALPHSLSTGLSLVIILGACYGALRLVIDVVRVVYMTLGFNSRAARNKPEE